LNYHWC